MGSFSNLVKLIEGNESFALLCHEDPDGDALGSILAMKKFLTAVGKSVRVMCNSSVPKVFGFLDGIEKIEIPEKLNKDEILIVLDCGDLRRTGMSDQIQKKRENNNKVINIDHHPKNDLWRWSDVNYVDTKASSVSEMVYRIAKGFGWPIEIETATAILCGIYTDTGGFQHSNTNENVMLVVSDLLACGARLNRISENISNDRSVAKLKIWGMAMDRLMVNEEYNIAFSYLKREDIVLSGASEEDVSGLVNVLNSTSNIRAIILIYESADGRIKGSLRTENNEIDLSLLANHLFGGGHKKAAGFCFEGKIMSTEDGSCEVC